MSYNVDRAKGGTQQQKKDLWSTTILLGLQQNSGRIQTHCRNFKRKNKELELLGYFHIHLLFEELLLLEFYELLNTLALLYDFNCRSMCWISAYL